MTPSPKIQAPVRIAQGRVKSNTPPIVPGHHYYNPNGHNNGYGRRSAVESVKEKPKDMDYFAGAKFDCLPSVSSLPTPPVEWTVPVLRSQSQPSSPVTTTGVRIDISSLFLTPQVNKLSHHHDLKNESTNDTAKNNIKQSETKTQKMMHDEIDTHRAKTVHHEKKVTTPSSRKQEDTKKNGHHQHSKLNNKYSKQDRSALKSSPKVESKPIDIVSSPHHGTYHHKQMYPHLTESLRCLLKVQG